MMIPHTRFFGAMSLAYLALGAVWGGLYIWHWAEVFTLQHCISAVIALSMMEMSTWRALPRARPKPCAWHSLSRYLPPLGDASHRSHLGP